jgi:DNA-binding MarR family transcriptional regulator
MPTGRQGEIRGPSSGTAPADSPRLGYLLKHAHLRYTELAADAFAALGVRPQEWVAVSCLGSRADLSQKEIADLLGVDRTTMVALVDELERKGLVERRPHAADRRKNVLVITAAGRSLMRRGARVADDCERRFLAALPPADADVLKRALSTVIAASPPAG